VIVNTALHVLFHPVLGTRLAAADLLQGQLPTLLIEFLEAVEAVPRVPRDLACPGYVAQHLGKVQQAYFVLDDLLLICVHLTFSFLRFQRSLSKNVRSSRD
jgi:hypothetical protein